MTDKPIIFDLSSLLEKIPVIQETKELKKSNRCPLDGCRAKIALSSFPCKCGLTFCTKHRHCEEHNCSYNFKMAGLIGLSTQLVKVTGERLKDKL